MFDSNELIGPLGKRLGLVFRSKMLVSDEVTNGNDAFGLFAAFPCFNAHMIFASPSSMVYSEF